MQSPPKQLLALDVGEKRIGVALANTVARLAKPFTTLINSDHIMADLQQLVQAENVQAVIVGLPRGVEGQETAQTRAVRAFGEQIAIYTEVPLFWQDEALTSVKANLELNSRRKASTKADVDALAATYILEDFLKDNPEGFSHG